MKGATGILLVGGGVFLLIALFSGQLKFPLGQVNILGSTLGDNLSNMLANVEGKPGPSANFPGAKPVQVTQPDKNTLKCQAGYTAYRASGGNLICVKNQGNRS
jgi:hypothetical protein